MIITINYSLVLLCVIERTLIDLPAFYLRARPSLIVKRMVFLLFPAMRSQAGGLQYAAFFVLADESSCLPVLAELMSIVVEYVRLSSKILPVVSIVALSLIMLFVEGTPLSLKVELIIVSILLHSMNYSCLQIGLGVCERAVLAIIAVG